MGVSMSPFTGLLLSCSADGVLQASVSTLRNTRDAADFVSFGRFAQVLLSLSMEKNEPVDDVGGETATDSTISISYEAAADQGTLVVSTKERPLTEMLRPYADSYDPSFAMESLWRVTSSTDERMPRLALVGGQAGFAFLVQVPVPTAAVAGPSAVEVDGGMGGDQSKVDNAPPKKKKKIGRPSKNAIARKLKNDEDEQVSIAVAITSTPSSASGRNVVPSKMVISRPETPSSASPPPPGFEQVIVVQDANEPDTWYRVQVGEENNQNIDDHS